MYKYLSLVKFSHTIFAMPFALIGFVYAIYQTEQFCILTSLCSSSSSRLGIAQFFGISTGSMTEELVSTLAPHCQLHFAFYILLIKVLLCMLFARNTAMGFNRWADRKIDAENPRTASREIPAGKISANRALIFVIINGLLFIVAASTINLLTALLSPVALAVILFYSYCKRFTSLSHLVLGLSLAIAPVGAYIAVTGRFALEPCILALLVMTWCGGFDIIYALQDADFDRQRGLYSIPARFSARTALIISGLLHTISVAALLWFASYCPGSWWLWSGVGIFISLLALQHILVTPTRQHNIGIAFGTLNGLASIALAAGVIIDLLK